MDDEVAVIDQHPFGVVVTFQADGSFAPGFEIVADGIANSLDLPLVRTAAEDKIISERGYFPKVEDADIGSLPGFSGAYGGKPERGVVRDLCQVRPPLS